MTFATTALVTLGLLLNARGVALAQTTTTTLPVNSLTDVSAYALGCYELLGMTKEAFKAANGNAATLDCKKGTKLSTRYTFHPDEGTPPASCNPFCDLVQWAADNPATTKWPGSNFSRSDGAAYAFPPTCDAPAWLSDKCYGNMYTLYLSVGSVDIVLNCRHKNTFGDDGDNTFDDIAMIMNSTKNGNTCWFQTPPGTARAGRAVPYPHDDTSTTYWYPPQDTAGVNCIRCHDNGPWMTSPFILAAGVVPRDTLKTKYLIPGAAFAAWKPVFVQVKDKVTCTRCHRISSLNHPDGTCARWINWSTGGGPGLHDEHPTSLNVYGTDWKQSGWMPSDTKDGTPPASATYETPDDWDATFEDSVEQLLTCCENPTDAECEQIPSEKVRGTKLKIKDNPLGNDRLRYQSKDVALWAPGPGGVSDPTITGATFKLSNPLTSESATFALPATDGATVLWKKDATGMKFRYKNPQAPAGPSAIAKALLQDGKLKVKAVGLGGFTLDEAGQGTLETLFTVGPTRYCARFATPYEDVAVSGTSSGRYQAKKQPPPSTCSSPSGAFLEP